MELLDRVICQWVVNILYSKLSIDTLAHLIETRAQKSIKDRLSAMDPSFKDYFDKLAGSLDAIHTDIPSHTAKLDDLAQWRPNLERRMDQLSTVVAEL